MTAKFDPKHMAFLADVDRHFMAAYGLTYSDVFQNFPNTFDPKGDMLWKSSELGRDPKSYAEVAGRVLALDRVTPTMDDDDIASLEHFNRHRLAINCFTSEPGSDSIWKLGTDGNAYRLTADARLVKLDVGVAEDGSSWGFRMQVSADQVAPDILAHNPSDPLGRPAVRADLPFEEGYTDFDLDIAEDRLNARLGPYKPPSGPSGSPRPFGG